MFLQCFVVVFFASFCAKSDAEKVDRKKFTVQPIFNVQDIMLGLVGFGNPTQLTKLELNPLSPEFFVIPSNCKPSGCLNNREGFNTTKSSSYKDNGRVLPFTTEYLGGKSSGIIANESLTALGISGNAPPVILLPVVDELEGPLINGYQTGVMGWGFLPEDSQQSASFLQILLKAVDLPVIEVFLATYSIDDKNQLKLTGNATYGNKDIDSCESTDFYLQTDNKRRWSIKLDSTKLGDKSLTGGTALFYPASGKILAPNGVVKNIRAQLNAKLDSKLNEYILDCPNFKHAPILILSSGKQILKYGARDYLYQISGSNKCILLIGELTARFKDYDWIDWVLGAPAFRQHCVYFDFNGPRLGFSNSKNYQDDSGSFNLSVNVVLSMIVAVFWIYV